MCRMCSSSLKVRSDFFRYEVKTREKRTRTSLQETRDFSSNSERDNNQSHSFTSLTSTARR